MVISVMFVGTGMG